MTEIFRLRCEDIQPSQLYISRLKLDSVKNTFAVEGIEGLEPIPIKELDGELISTDGHTRGVFLHMEGHREFDCCWEDWEMDWDAYRICVGWCKEENIQDFGDLVDRIIPHERYEVVWLARCNVMQDELETKRGM